MGKDVVAKVAKIRQSGKDATQVMENTQKELAHEIKMLCKLRHPSLLQFVGAWIDVNKGYHGLLTEYCQAGDVEHYMQRQRQKTKSIYVPPTRLALQWAFSAADALGFLHNLDCPIIHRDVKPLNLLLTKALDLKLTDLGLSKVMPCQSRGCSRPAPKMSGGVGTWRYMAPEVVRYEEYTDRADVYSFSLILVFLFSGKPPFHEFAKDDPELIRKAWHIDAASRPSAKECACHFSRMLEVVPARRPWTHKAVQSLFGNRKRSVALERNSELFERSTTV